LVDYSLTVFGTYLKSPKVTNEVCAIQKNNTGANKNIGLKVNM